VSIAVAKRKLGRLDFEANVRMIWVKARLTPDEKPDEETAKVNRLHQSRADPRP
jgi:hypothetical protein